MSDLNQPGSDDGDTPDPQESQEAAEFILEQLIEQFEFKPLEPDTTVKFMTPIAFDRPQIQIPPDLYKAIVDHIAQNRANTPTNRADPEGGSPREHDRDD